MPTYEYECKTCGHNFEVFQSMKDDPLKECPECKGEVRRLIFGGTGVIFKGSGFYVTDKGGKKESKQAVSKKPEDGSALAKADASAKADSAQQATPSKTEGGSAAESKSA